MGEYQFQIANINWLNDKYKEKKRLLIADETGLGKTYTAAGIIAKLAIEKKKNSPKEKFWVLYICSGQIIARKNMPELAKKVYEIGKSVPLINKSDIMLMSSKYDARLSMPRDEFKNSYVQIINATPGTSFKKIGGNREEINSLKEYLPEEFLKQLEIPDSNTFSEEKNELYNKLYEARKSKTIELLKTNKYDLVILDEFQSYEEILSEYLIKDNHDIVLSTVSDLFAETKILMLSATPYKIDKDGLTLEDKLCDFKKILRFLSDTDTDKSLIEAFEKYQAQLMKRPVDFDGLQNSKKCFETELCKYVRRNQRQYAMGDNDFYTKIIKSSNMYRDSDSAEKVKTRLLKQENDSENICDEDKTEREEKRSLLSLSEVRNYPYPPGFIKGYKAWENGKYIDCIDLFPEMEKWTGDGACKNCLNCKNNKNESNKQCEKIYSRENIKFQKNISCALNCIEDILGEKIPYKDSIYKIAWLPPSSSEKLKPPFSEVPKFFSKLLVFTGNIPETRSIAAYFSSKSYCEDSDKCNKAEEVINSLVRDKQDPLYKCVEKAIGEGKPFIVEIWYASLLEYFKRKEIIHVLANAGIETLQQFESYINAGDLKSVIVEYMSTINFSMPECCLELKDSKKLLEIVLKHVSEKFCDYIKNCIADILTHEYENPQNTIFVDSSVRAELTINQFSLLQAVHKRDTEKQEELKAKLIPENNLKKQKATAKCLDGAREYRNYLAGINKEFSSFDTNFNADDCIKDQIRAVSEVLGYNTNKAIKEVELNYDNIGCKYTTAKKDKFTPSKVGVELVLGDTGLFENNGYLNKMVDYLQEVKEMGIAFYPESKVCIASKYKNKEGNYEVGCGRMPVGFSMRLTEDIQDVEDSNEAGMQKIIAAFNSPFYPFILATTDVAKEGISLHSYCRKILHLNIKEQAAIMIQRNGRIDRYNSLVIRQRIAYNHEKKGCITNWEEAYEAYNKECSSNDNENGMIPHWYVSIKDENGPKIEEYRYYNSASLETFKLNNVETNIAVYKSVIGSFLPEEAIEELRNELDVEQLGLLNLRLV